MNLVTIRLSLQQRFIIVQNRLVFLAKLRTTLVPTCSGFKICMYPFTDKLVALILATDPIDISLLLI